MNRTQYNYNATGLTKDAIRQLAPSVFAESAHESRSARYTFIPTITILEALDREGFVPTQVIQSTSRQEGHENHTKHLIRFRSRNDLGYKPEVFEVALINSHDGSSGYQLMAALWRQVCSNGMMRGDFKDSIRVRHTGNIVTEVVTETLKIAETSGHMFDEIARMKATTLTDAERRLFAKYAMLARFDLDQEEENGVSGEVVSVSESPVPSTALTLYQPQDFLRIRRRDDAAPDVFTTLNVLQENVIKGGVSRRDARGKKHTTRQIKGIDQSVRLNKMLWAMAQEMMKLKNQ